ncbi:hypothetical protein N0V88_004214 [Collariella sp. IMI 366227]|nr:hypothetical protein N0V88_004214 [Collariella sp. IMI 366227]
MAPFIGTYPPLGNVTQLQDPHVDFQAVLEVPKEQAKDSWQLSLWHSDSKGEWTETQVLLVTSGVQPTDLHEASEETARLYFRTELTVQSSLNFTIKFRQGSEHDWRWVRDEQGVDDGTVIINANGSQNGPEELPDIIKGLNPDLKWKSHASQSPKTQLWSIEAAVNAAKEDESTHGKSSFQLDKDAMLCSFLSPKGKHLVFLGVSDVNDVTTLFKSGDSGHLNLYIRNDNSVSTTATALVAVGDDIESAIAAVMYHARTLLTAATADVAEAVAEVTPQSELKPAWYEKWYDGLGYCTWNSLGQELTEEKVLKALDTLAENNINISSLIIDDNWQDIDYRGDGQWQYGWNDFEAEPKTFPRGLKALVSDIRSKHRNIQHIAVWHALLGYWAGLAPNGPLAKRYKTVTVTRNDTEPSQLPIDGLMTLVAPSDIPTFYNDFYHFLSSSGIDGVKTDGQYMIDTLTSPPPAAPSFPPTSTPGRSPPSGTSRAASSLASPQHPPDWDMFQTVHDYAGFRRGRARGNGGYNKGKDGGVEAGCAGQDAGGALGVLGIYISALSELSVEDDFMVTIQGQPIPPHTVSKNSQDEHVLDVDIETAWKEMELESGWSNEVEVKVYFGLKKK